MKHPIAKVVLPITLSAFLLTGCQSPSTSVSSSSLSQPSTVISSATVSPVWQFLEYCIDGSNGHK